MSNQDPKPPVGGDGKPFPVTTDAGLWVRTWQATLEKQPDVPTDATKMLGWFSHAIHAGFDAGRIKSMNWMADVCRKNLEYMKQEKKQAAEKRNNDDKPRIVKPRIIRP